MIDNLKRRRKGYLRTGKVKVLPVRRSNDWLPENADSAFMNTGAKVEYVVPRLRSGQLIDPLADLTDEQKNIVARQLGLKDSSDLNVMIQDEKKNFWVNKAVVIDRDGLFLDLTSVSDFIDYKIFEVNLDFIAPSWEERYNKGTYKFAIVFEDEESKIKNIKIDTNKEAYMIFGKIDGNIKKLTDFLWIHYLTNIKDGKRLPNNPSLEYLRGEVGRIIEERPGEFLSIITDAQFETKALIQKAINNGFIQRSGQTFQIFGEDSSKGSLEGLIEYLNDERNNNVRLSIIGRIEQVESGIPVDKDIKASDQNDNVNQEEDDDLKNKLAEAEKRAEEAERKTAETAGKIDEILNVVEGIKEDNALLKKENEDLRATNSNLSDQLVSKDTFSSDNTESKPSGNNRTVKKKTVARKRK